MKRIKNKHLSPRYCFEPDRGSDGGFGRDSVVSRPLWAGRRASRLLRRFARRPLSADHLRRFLRVLPAVQQQRRRRQGSMLAIVSFILNVLQCTSVRSRVVSVRVSVSLFNFPLKFLKKSINPVCLSPLFSFSVSLSLF